LRQSFSADLKTHFSYVIRKQLRTLWTERIRLINDTFQNLSTHLCLWLKQGVVNAEAMLTPLSTVQSKEELP
jgi:hypothetical protein